MPGLTNALTGWQAGGKRLKPTENGRFTKSWRNQKRGRGEKTNEVNSNCSEDVVTPRHQKHQGLYVRPAREANERQKSRAQSNLAQPGKSRRDRPPTGSRRKKPASFRDKGVYGAEVACSRGGGEGLGGGGGGYGVRAAGNLGKTEQYRGKGTVQVRRQTKKGAK